MGDKSVFLAYLFWGMGGWYGLHHFYLGRDRHAIVWWCMLAGYGGIGWLNDLFKIPMYVEEANYSDKFLRKLTEQMIKYTKPRFSLYRFMGQLTFGNLLAWLLYRALPEDETLFGFPFTWLHFIIPLGSAIGVHNVGNIGREEGELKWPLLGAYLVYPFFTVDNPRYNLSTFCAAIFFRHGVKWNRRPPTMRNTCKRFLILSTCAFLYSALWSSNLYFNVSFTNEYGETIKLRDSVKNLLNSPLWNQLKESVVRLREYYRIYGWHNLWEEIIRNLDPLGEQNALYTLDLPISATQQDITKKWRELSRKYHPDKFVSESEKAVALAKFLEIKEAYEKISTIHSKRKNQSSKSRGRA